MEVDRILRIQPLARLGGVIAAAAHFYLGPLVIRLSEDVSKEFFASFLQPTFTNIFFHLVRDLFIPFLLVPIGVAIHLIYTDADLFQAQQIDPSRALARLA